MRINHQVLYTTDCMPRRHRRYRPHIPQFRVRDLAQQAVGGFLLSGTFVVTEEVWVLARHLPILNSVLVVGVVMLTGYVALYRADTTHDVTQEADVRGVPLQFLSLMGVSFGSVALLAFAAAIVSSTHEILGYLVSSLLNASCNAAPARSSASSARPISGNGSLSRRILTKS